MVCLGRPYQFKVFQGCLPQNLLRPFLNILTHMCHFFQIFLGESGRRGYMEAVPCSYKFLCRLVLIQNNGNLLELKYRANGTSEVTILGNVRESLAIVSAWSKICFSSFFFSFAFLM